MKKLIVLFSMLAVCLSAFSQSNLEEIEFYQSIFGMEKKAIVSSFISLEGEASDSFWSQYDEYESARKANGQKRLELLGKYANSYLNLDDATTDALVSESMTINKEHTKLINKYYKSMKKAAGSRAAAQFYQLENYFHGVVRTSLMEEIPFIGEFGL
jgi:hypothetical protein